MDRSRHGYTNRSRRLVGGFVEKAYDGWDARERADREFSCLAALGGTLPVPEVVQRNVSRPVLKLREVSGMHGQDLIAGGHATEVLRLLGVLVVRLQRIDPFAVPGLPGSGEVIVHGDYGPQNVLVEHHRISALLDWEFAHVGRRIEDLAWTEWIIRMHHPDVQDSLSEFFKAAQLHPVWVDRQAVMLGHCMELLRRAERDGSPNIAELWRARLVSTESWSE